MTLRNSSRGAGTLPADRKREGLEDDCMMAAQTAHGTEREMRDDALELEQSSSPAGEQTDGVSLYRAHLARRGFGSGPSQWRAVERLQRLYEEWTAYKARRNNALKRLLVRPPLPKGVYLWGRVGRGESVLMDS